MSPFDKNPFAHPDVHHSPKRKKTEGCASVTHLRGHPRGASTPALRRYRRHHYKARPSPIRISDCGFSAGRPSFGNPKTATDAQCGGDDDARVQTRGRRARRPHVVSHALGAHHNVGSLSKPRGRVSCHDAGALWQLWLLLPRFDGALGRSRRSIGVVLGLNRVVCGADWLSGFARDRVRTLNRETRLPVACPRSRAGWNTNRIRGLRARPDGRARGSCHGCAASSPADASDRTSGGARRPPVYTKVHISWTGSVDRHDFVWDRCPRPSPVVGPVQASPWAGTGRRGGPVAAGGVGGQGLAARR